MTHPSRYELDRWVAGEPIGDIDTHINGCEVCRAYVSHREEERQFLQTSRPAESFLWQLEQRTRHQAPERRFGRWISWRVGWVAAASAAIVAAILWVTWPGATSPSGAHSTTHSSEELRWMGGYFAAQIFVKRGDRVFVPDDDPIRPGDKVQFEVTPKKGQAGYIAVAATDDQGVTIVLPSGSETAVEISGKTLLPGSVDLDDDAAGTELCLFVRTASFSLVTLQAEIQTAIQDGKALSSLTGGHYCFKVSK